MNKIKRAIVSVYNKKNLKKLLICLKKFNIEIISSGGTFREIKKLGFSCIELSRYTNNLEILEGRVKTLHPKIYAGILNKRNSKKHNKEMKINKYDHIDLVIVNFYPFEEILSNTSDQNKIIENIDIGGPTMVRAAAKNYKDVTVITSDTQYDELIENIKLNKGKTSLEFRKKMSLEAFSETSYYDSLISNYFCNISNEKFPKKKVIGLKRLEKLRYGENPHQKATVYKFLKNFNLEKLGGKDLSYNNYSDIFSALKISRSLPGNIGTVIVKHGNPCGVSIHKEKVKSFKLAFNSDPTSAFGGIVSCNFKINEKIAKEINKIFFEVVIGNGFENKALKILKKKKNLRIIDSRKVQKFNDLKFFSNGEAVLLQTADENKFETQNFKVVSKTKPNSKTLKNLIFAFNVCRFVKSNAIVITQKETTIGIGSGQPSRLDSCELAINKMNKFHKLKNEEILAASDAFFPFIDGIEKLVQAGVTGIIQPYGSIRDKEIIDFANKTKTVLVFSKTRHFNH